MEGDMVGWKVGANLAMPRMKMIAAKDFLWNKTETRGWQGQCCPLGQGMCKYGEFMRMVAASGFQGPMSVHIEYQIPGVSDDQGRSLTREGDDQVMAAAQRDLATLKSMVRTAYAT
jgi:sugar phosphate isomerase/epimerase